MKIGIDLRVLQIGHQYRGIGEVAKRTLNGIFEQAIIENSNNTFVFFMYDDEVDPLAFLELPSSLMYETVLTGRRPVPELPQSIQEKVRRRWRELFGNPLPQARHCDVFLQYDYALGVPRGVRTVLIKHDIIPYLFWNDYFESAWVPFKNRAARTTLRTLFNNYAYKRILKRSVRHARTIVCVSEHTRQDLHKYLYVPLKKMKVIYLGVSEVALRSPAKPKKEMPAHLPTKPYLLFVGAVDARRRRIDDLIAAYNNLKADGHDIQLVLAGENFKSANEVPNEVVRTAIKRSLYAKDILTLGYIDDATKQALFKGALAYVFPTTYEGFGIPVLEAMLLRSPVITYKNSSIPEVGGDAVLYASSWEGIWRRVEEVLVMSAEERTRFLDYAQSHARAFTWDKTSLQLYDELTKPKRI